MKVHEEHKRSIAKAVTYRLYQSFIISPVIVYLLTGKIGLAATFGVVEFIIKIPAYYAFERAWSMVKQGYTIEEKNG